MDKLSKAQKDEYATAFAILALYDGGVSDHNFIGTLLCCFWCEHLCLALRHQWRNAIETWRSARDVIFDHVLTRVFQSQADVNTEQINALLDATGNEVEAFYPIIFSQFCSPTKLAQLIALPAAGGGGGGGGGGGAAGGAAEEEAKEEEKPEEEEEAPAAAAGMFGDDGGGGKFRCRLVLLPVVNHSGNSDLIFWFAGDY